MDQSTAVMIVVTVLVVAVVGLWATRSATDPREARRWAAAHGVVVTPSNLGLVAYFVPLVGVLRVIGGCGGLVLASLFDLAIGTRASVGFGTWSWIVGGWCLGAWLADREVGAYLRPGAGASLTARRLPDYLPWGLRAAPALGAALVAALAAGLPADGPSTTARVASVVVALSVAVVVRLGQSSVLGRPQPADDPSVVAADDAVRTTAVHHLGGGGTAITLFVASGLAGAALSDAASAAPSALFALTVLGGLVTWRFYAFRPWRVRRSGPPASPRLADAHL